MGRAVGLQPPSRSRLVGGVGRCWSVAGSKLGRPGCRLRAPRPPSHPGREPAQGTARALTSRGVSARRFGPRSRSDPDPQLWLPPRSGRGLRDPLKLQLPGLRRGSWGGGTATRTAPPPNPQEPMGARGCGARALRGARALAPPTGAGKPGCPPPGGFSGLLTPVVNRWPPTGLPAGPLQGVAKVRGNRERGLTRVLFGAGPLTCEREMLPGTCQGSRSFGAVGGGDSGSSCTAAPLGHDG